MLFFSSLLTFDSRNVYVSPVNSISAGPAFTLVIWPMNSVNHVKVCLVIPYLYLLSKNCIVNWNNHFQNENGLMTATVSGEENRE